jgi:hypothetical protein
MKRSIKSSGLSFGVKLIMNMISTITQIITSAKWKKNQFKAIIFVLTICNAGAAFSQQAFSKVALKNLHNRESICFSVPKEVNVRHYRVEASNDNVNFDIIATIPAKTNSVLAVNYNYDLSAHAYAYYRIAMVGMNGDMPYSAVVARPLADPNPGNIKTSPAGTISLTVNK